MLYHISKKFFQSEKIKLHKQSMQRGVSSPSVTDSNGYKAKVYLTELFFILTTKELPLQFSNETINGFEFIKSYVEGYKTGVEYFKSNYEVDVNTLYNNSEHYIKDLHICYFHKDPLSHENRGWNWYETNYPFMFSEKTINQFGLYAGILSELKKMQKKHYALFKKFWFVCEHEVEDDNRNPLEKIFDSQKPGYTICKELFIELNIKDSVTGNIELTKGKGYLLFGLIAAIKESQHNLLNRNYTDDKLLSVFNTHLGTDFKQLKRDSAGFETAKDTAKDYINSSIK